MYVRRTLHVHVDRSNDSGLGARIEFGLRTSRGTKRPSPKKYAFAGPWDYREVGVATICWNLHVGTVAGPKLPNP